MSPPRRPRPGHRARPRTPPTGVGIARRDLEALLAQLDRRPRRAEDAEVGRLRRLLAEAIAAGAESDGDEDEGWDDEDEGWEDEDEGWEDEEPWDPWASRRRWQRTEPARPIPVEGGLTARSRRGAIGESWWSKRFLAAIEAAMEGGRSTRGRSYARKGQVVDLSVSAGLVEAHVQGTRRTPYRVRLALPVVPDGDWERIAAALAAEAGHAARLLAGELPHEVEDVFAAEGASLFPSPTARLTTDCTCPDWANPCKHVAAVCYLTAEAFDRDPFAVLAWRGRTRDELLDLLRALRADDANGEPEAGAGAGAPPPAAAPPLAECLVGFWKAGPELAGVRVRPEAAVVPGAVLRHLTPGLLEAAGRDVGELLEPAYADLAAGAARRALAADEPPARPGRASPRSSGDRPAT